MAAVGLIFVLFDSGSVEVSSVDVPVWVLALVCYALGAAAVWGALKSQKGWAAGAGDAHGLGLPSRDNSAVDGVDLTIPAGRFSGIPGPTAPGRQLGPVYDRRV